MNKEQLDKLSNLVETIESEFCNYGDMQVELVQDDTLPDYDENFINQKIIITDESWDIHVELYIEKDYETMKVYIIDDIYEDVGSCFEVVWRQFYFEAGRKLGEYI